MSIKQFSGKVINSFLSQFGYELHHSEFFLQKNREIEALKDVSLDGALSRISSKALEIETVIDIGASDGQWSSKAMKYFPKAFYFLLEANKVHISNLNAFKQKNNNADYLLAAAGDKEGEVFLYFN
jgi:hypothetical protein